MSKLALTVGAIAAAALAGCGGGLGDAPDVRGLSLPEARHQLKAAGYSASVTDDAMFGVIIPSHFTVCDESGPKGNLVPLKVSKEC